eukprot:TRINITY_DN23393_c0_g1_i1.p1 TRINITY_DN23393_c0_g1~~TRINITY_DN23393_c0_g1_i1.p1  ORF type:complete len:360 (+),score=51.40 TRINITY_DN23393_c0_g1_i1:32-1111(+)
MIQQCEQDSHKEKRKAAGENTPDPEKKRKVTIRDIKGVDRLSDQICEEIIAEWKRSRLGNAEKQQESELVNKLNQIAKKWITKGTATIYGSRLIGTASFNSDIDISFSWPGYKPVNTPEMEEVMNKKIAKLCKTLGSKSFHHAFRIPGKTKVVTCTAADTGISVDITFNNAHAVEVSKVLRVVTDYFPEFAAAMWFLKKLGKSREFTNPKHKKLSSYCLSIMLCYVMQISDVIPTLVSPISPESVDKQFIERGFRKRNSSDIDAMILSKVIAKFFTTYHTNPVINVTLEAVCPDKTETSTHKSPIYIHDPLDNSNCARMLSDAGWLHAISEFGRAIDCIRNTDPLTSWFDSSDLHTTDG